MINNNIGTETPEQEKKRLRKVATATIVGSMLEWYDFYLYATMAALVFGQIFFDTSDPKSASLKAFATFAIGFIARPVGGMLFGRYGDRFGRKKMLVVTFCLMGICTTLIGIIPSYNSIGVWAPILLVSIRFLQGLGAGAELAGAAITSYEHASTKKRGSQGAWPAIGLNLGLLLSSLTVYILSLFGKDFLLNGGWRIPFILSFVLVFVGLWVRKSLPETPDFAKVVQDHKRDKAPFHDIFRFHMKGLLVAFFLALGYNALSYTFKTFSLAYLAQYKNITNDITSLSITLASLVAIFTIPCFGWLCDKWSSKWVMIVGAIITFFYILPFMWFLDLAQEYWIYFALIITTGFLTPMMFAAQGSFLSRQFPVQVRSTGIGTGREIGGALGGLAPLLALYLVKISPDNSTIGVTVILLLAALSVIIAALCDQGKRFTDNRN